MADIQKASPVSGDRVPFWPPAWDAKHTVNTDAEAKALVARCATRRRVMLANLAKRSEAGGERAAKRLSRRYLKSASARIAVFRMACSRKRMKAGTDITWQSVVQIGQTLDPWTVSSIKAVAIDRERPNGKRRLIYSFSAPDYALQLLAKDVAETIRPPSREQFIMNGGRPALERWLAEELPSTRYVLTTDIPNCFDTIRKVSVDAGLPLPRKVKKAVLHGPRQNAVFLTMGPTGLIEMTQDQIAGVSPLERGVPQGSALSSIGAEGVIGKVLEAVRQAAPGCKAAAYGDNLIFLLNSADDAASVHFALTSAVAANFGLDVIGGLTGRIVGTPVKKGVEFCGRVYTVVGGKLKIGLANDALSRFSSRFLEAISDAWDAKSIEKMDAIGRSLQGWMRQNAGIPGIWGEFLDMAGHYQSMRSGLISVLEKQKK